VLARTPVASVIVVLAVDPQLLAPVLQQARRLVGLVATVIRIAGSMQARVTAVVIASKGFALKAVDAATAIQTAGSMQVRAIAVAIASNSFAPEAAAFADEVRKSLRLRFLWNSIVYVAPCLGAGSWDRLSLMEKV